MSDDADDGERMSFNPAYHGVSIIGFPEDAQYCAGMERMLANGARSIYQIRIQSDHLFRDINGEIHDIKSTDIPCYIVDGIVYGRDIDAAIEALQGSPNKLIKQSGCDGGSCDVSKDTLVNEL
jgi:hypothetical protein